MKNHLRTTLTLAILLALAFLTPGKAYAARLLEFTIEQDGQIVLSGIWDDRGTEDAATVWSCLRTVQFSGPLQLDEVARDGSSHVLRGKLVIRASHAKRVLAEAKVDELELVRHATPQGHWRLAASEVERTARVAGFPELPALLDKTTLLARLGGAAAVLGLLIGLLAWVYLRRQRRSAMTQGQA